MPSVNKYDAIVIGGGHNGLTAAGSITLPSNQVEFIEKPASYTIHGSGDFRATKVGFTN